MRPEAEGQQRWRSPQKLGDGRRSASLRVPGRNKAALLLP